jgi:hypothetical protein
MNCDRQQRPDQRNRQSHFELHPLNLSLYLVGNASLIGKVFGGVFVFVWV